MEGPHLAGLLVVAEGAGELGVQRLDVLLSRLRLPRGLPAAHPGHSQTVWRSEIRNWHFRLTFPLQKQATVGLLYIKINYLN